MWAHAKYYIKPYECSRSIIPIYYHHKRAVPLFIVMALARAILKCNSLNLEKMKILYAITQRSWILALIKNILQTLKNRQQ
jgi:hypothetical protein